ncbi:hypothetical protein F4678DRAFT_195063 [Xylaria arbuscula]|nr:hypothetical protein F4678DRAFT_195063 [Xylaria arbuscula]
MLNCTITNQSDAEALDYCINLEITGAEGTLTFPKLTFMDSCIVHNSPQLTELSFPNVTAITSMVVENADYLTILSLPMVKGGEALDNGGILGGSIFHMNITNAPNLTSIELESSMYYEELILSGIPAYANFGLNLTSAATIQTSSCLSFSQLETVGDLTIDEEEDGCDYGLASIKSIGNLTILNANAYLGDDLYVDLNNSSFTMQLNGSLSIIGSSELSEPNGPVKRLPFAPTSSIPMNLEVKSVRSLPMDFSDVMTVGGNISLSHNTNCTFDFSQLATAGNITMLDNTDTTLPLFPDLKTVDNIHLRGNIDTSTGPNIFPSLVLARGNVTVEPWNSDFNCSKLVSQWNNGLIHNLSCNGTGNGSTTSTSTPSITPTPDTNHSTGLSPGAKAGIGVGVAVGGILVIALITWLILRRKNRSKNLKNPQPLTPDKELPGMYSHADTSGTQEADGTVIVAEKPDDHIVEKPDDHIIAEKPDDHVIGEVPDDHIVELPAEDVRVVR